MGKAVPLYIKGLERGIFKGLEIFKAFVPLLGSEWGNKYFFLSAESSGTEGRWQCYPYQIGPLNWMTCDDIEEVNFCKSRRIGYTKMLLAASGCLIHQKKRNIATWQPTDGDAHDFVVDEVESMLRDVKVLRDLLKSDIGTKSKHNTLEKKSFLGATWDIKGGKSARNFRRMSKDVAQYDELSAFDSDIDGEGSATEIGDGRLDQAPFPKSIRGSTPKIKGLCQIEAAFLSCEFRFYRFVKCPHCGALFPLKFELLRWDKGKPETAHFVCPENGCVMFYRDLKSMDSGGRWQTLDGFYYNDETDTFHNPAGEKIDKPRRLGARIWAAYSYLRPWSWLVDKWLQAIADEKTGKVEKLKAFVNTLLGETYEERGESVNAGAIGDSERLEDYHYDTGIPNGVLYITGGVDVQGGQNPRLELELVGWGEGDESWSLDYVIINGDPAEPDVWAHLDSQFDRVFKRLDGVELRVSGAFVDSGYETQKVYDYTRPRKIRNIFATKGVLTGITVNKGTYQGEGRRRTILRTMNVSEAKTTVFRRLKKDEPGPGYCHFPNWYPERYFKGLANEEKREKRKRGVVVGYEWVQKGFNEPIDCRVYATGCAIFLNKNTAVLKAELDRRAELIRLGMAIVPTRKKRRVRSKGVNV